MFSDVFSVSMRDPGVRTITNMKQFKCCYTAKYERTMCVRLTRDLGVCMLCESIREKVSKT